MAALVACGSGVKPAETVCGATSRPKAQDCKVNATGDLDLMAWTPQERANVVRLMKQGAVVVRLEPNPSCGVKLETISGCTAKGHYAYSPYAAHETKRIESRTDLYTSLPIGAVSLEGQLGCEKSLRTDFDLVGLAALPPETVVARPDLEGPDCGRATHVLGRIYVGGFALVSGDKASLSAKASVFGAGAGGSDTSSLATLQSEGTKEQCDAALKTEQAKALCSAPLRVGLLPVRDAVEMAKVPIDLTLEPGKKLPRLGRDLPETYGLVCPPGEAIVGIHGSAAGDGQSRSRWIWKFGVSCAAAVASRDARGNPQVVRGQPHRLREEMGMGGGEPFETICPENQFVVALNAEWRPRSDDGTGPEYIGRVNVMCGGARVTAQGGAFTVAIGTESTLPAAGSSLGGQSGLARCADGQQPADGLMTSIHGFAGNLLETLVGACSTPKVSVRSR